MQHMHVASRQTIKEFHKIEVTNSNRNILKKKRESLIPLKFVVNMLADTEEVALTFENSTLGNPNTVQTDRIR